MPPPKPLPLLATPLPTLPPLLATPPLLRPTLPLLLLRPPTRWLRLPLRLPTLLLLRPKKPRSNSSLPKHATAKLYREDPLRRVFFFVRDFSGLVQLCGLAA